RRGHGGPRHQTGADQGLGGFTSACRRWLPAYGSGGDRRCRLPRRDRARSAGVAWRGGARPRRNLVRRRSATRRTGGWPQEEHRGSRRGPGTAESCERQAQGSREGQVCRALHRRRDGRDRRDPPPPRHRVGTAHGVPTGTQPLNAHAITGHDVRVGGGERVNGDLGTLLGVWAHPDDETYLSGGLMATAAAEGRRVVCVTATKGEAGFADDDPRDGAERMAVREVEATTSLQILGVREHGWLGYPDGGCAEVPDAAPVARLT